MSKQENYPYTNNRNTQTLIRFKLLPYFFRTALLQSEMILKNARYFQTLMLTSNQMFLFSLILGVITKYIIPFL